MNWSVQMRRGTSTWKLFALGYRFLFIIKPEIELTRTQTTSPYFARFEFTVIFFPQIKQNTPDASERGLVFILCGIHAREWISPATCMYILRQVSRFECTSTTSFIFI